jgi:hypothetical protein
MAVARRRCRSSFTVAWRDGGGRGSALVEGEPGATARAGGRELEEGGRMQKLPEAWVPIRGPHYGQRRWAESSKTLSGWCG